MDTDVKEVLSAFVDGERVEPVDLASALGEPGALEALIDFVRLRAALADDSGPSERFAQEMREQLDDRRRRRLPRPLRLFAAAAVFVLATLGVLDLGRKLGPERQPDQPPPATRVIRFEPGVDWMPVQGR
jgi:hypothetical protein